jgi:hypothetical protein
MNLNRFNTRHDMFNVLDLQAAFNFKSSSSVCFRLGKLSKKGGTVIRDFQVHHPCEGHIKAQLYIHLPTRYQNSLVELQKAAFCELGIPDDETYELSFFDTEAWTGMGQYVNREGISDRV